MVTLWIILGIVLGFASGLALVVFALIALWNELLNIDSPKK